MTNTNKQIADKAQTEELFLFAINDGKLYEQTIIPSIKMLQRKIKRGVFNEDKAIQYYSNTFAIIAMNAYKKEIGSIGGPVNQATKNAFGKEMYEHIKEHLFPITSFIKRVDEKGAN